MCLEQKWLLMLLRFPHLQGILWLLYTNRSLGPCVHQVCPHLELYSVQWPGRENTRAHMSAAVFSQFLIWPLQYPFKGHEIKSTNSIGNTDFLILHEFLSSWVHEFFAVFDILIQLHLHCWLFVSLLLPQTLRQRRCGFIITQNKGDAHFLGKCFYSVAVEQMQIFIQMQPRAGKFQGDVPAYNKVPPWQSFSHWTKCSVKDQAVA